MQHAEEHVSLGGEVLTPKRKGAEDKGGGVWRAGNPDNTLGAVNAIMGGVGEPSTLPTRVVELRPVQCGSLDLLLDEQASHSHGTENNMPETTSSEQDLAFYFPALSNQRREKNNLSF